MANVAGVAAETDCCGNLYPLHVPLGRPWSLAGVAATAIAVAVRLVQTVAVLCLGSAPAMLLRAGLL